jgi:hypothetical protein
MDKKLLIGGVILPEWCSYIIKEADIVWRLKGGKFIRRDKIIKLWI